MTCRNNLTGKLSNLLITLTVLTGFQSGQSGFAETHDIEEIRKAAEQGDAKAQFDLGNCYLKAYAWVNLAAAQGNKEAVKGKDLLRPKMTREQVAVPPLISWTDKTHHTQAAGCKARRWRARTGGSNPRRSINQCWL